MKDKVIKMRATLQEVNKFNELAKRRGVTLTSIIRNCLERELEKEEM